VGAIVLEEAASSLHSIFTSTSNEVVEAKAIVAELKRSPKETRVVVKRDFLGCLFNLQLLI
jgi:hypothetical protein